MNEIINKIHKIQSEITKLVRSEENKFQKYKFFDELQVLDLLKPLLKEHKLAITLSDDNSSEFVFQKDGNQYLVKYLKKMEVINAEKNEEKLTFYFWAIGLNADPAKAKGAAETYAIKYMLSKFFLMPVEDDKSDPDFRNSNQKERREEILKRHETKGIR